MDVLMAILVIITIVLGIFIVIFVIMGVVCAWIEADIDYKNVNKQSFNMKSCKNELRPCPFCGKQIELQLTDKRGNFKSDSYLDDPYSGIGYVLRHVDQRDDDQCPIAHEDDYAVYLGGWIYDSKEEAISNWNRRIGNG